MSFSWVVFFELSVFQTFFVDWILIIFGSNIKENLFLLLIRVPNNFYFDFQWFFQQIYLETGFKNIMKAFFIKFKTIFKFKFSALAIDLKLQSSFWSQKFIKTLNKLNPLDIFKQQSMSKFENSRLQSSQLKAIFTLHHQIILRISFLISLTLQSLNFRF